MNKILLILFICVVGVFAYHQVKNNSTQSNYSLSEVQDNPIPKHDALILWQEVAFEKCDTSQEIHNISPKKCRDIVRSRHSSCSVASSGVAPEMITETTQIKTLGRAYLECVTPYYFCNGVEVRTEEEEKVHCS